MSARVGKPMRTFHQDDCAPDCAQRAGCDRAGEFMHMMCGYCWTHDLPVHHCGCIVQVES